MSCDVNGPSISHLLWAGGGVGAVTGEGAAAIAGGGCCSRGNALSMSLQASRGLDRGFFFHKREETRLDRASLGACGWGGLVG